ncbi:DUF1697 domain-containing protein [Paenibacillus sp. R14(2021)]|uniref:DUF1697 domain-containing protein n=1 Tax=Paenibacillus sp. R14(2021) TaxID=2859228 RepID=UPI001C613FFF|nr:DUF1697 domain-containing protein [Paenibacillus sp. R14(2021)]
MTVYIALIRGINVGGKNKIAMAELRQELEAVGLNRVQTYIQSGNVVFESEHSASALRESIEQAITRISGITAQVMLRTSVQWEAIIDCCPYPLEAAQEGKSVHLSVLHEPLTDKQIEKLNAGVSELNRYQTQELEIYCHYGQSIMDSKLAGNFAKLRDGVTTRNWNTVLKLQEMIQAM